MCTICVIEQHLYNNYGNIKRVNILPSLPSQIILGLHACTHIKTPVLLFNGIYNVNSINLVIRACVRSAGFKRNVVGRKVLKLLL